MAHASVFGTNLIVNSGAEAGAGSPDGSVIVLAPGWTTSGNFNVVPYGVDGFPAPSSPGPPDRGENFFAGGPDESFSSATQSINVTSAGPEIDAGTVTYTLSGWLGGWDFQGDYARLTASFLDSGSNSLGYATIGPVTNVERSSITGLLFRTTSGTLPVGTRSIGLELDMTREQGAYDDGYADNLSLELNTSSGAIPEPAALSVWAILGICGALGAARRSRDGRR